MTTIKDILRSPSNTAQALDQNFREKYDKPKSKILKKALKKRGIKFVDLKWDKTPVKDIMGVPKKLID